MFKKLLGQSAVYGVSSIVGRFLNYLLVPFYTRVFINSEYGLVAELYAYTAFLYVILTLGLESGFFKFANKNTLKQVYSTTVITTVLVSGLFLLFVAVFLQPIADTIKYSDKPLYILAIAAIIFFDVIASIPFAKLRYQGKPMFFAKVKLINIGLNIGLNLFLLLLLPMLIDGFEISIGLIFVANLVASASSVVLLSKVILTDFSVKHFHKETFKHVFMYSIPLMVSGLAIVVNSTIDKALLKHLITVPDGAATDYAQAQLGIYSASYKIAVLMSLFIQAFRYAAEPFFFSVAKNTDAKQVYAALLKFFSLASFFVVLGIMAYFNLIRHFIDQSYWSGLTVVPVLLAAFLFYGITYNLSVWYKVSNHTKFGFYITAFGAIVTIILNIVFIPKYGYMASAWATLFSYISMAIVSYILSIKYYPIPYQKLSLLVHALVFGVLLFSIMSTKNLIPVFQYIVNTVILITFVAYVFFTEKHDLKKYFK